MLLKRAVEKLEVENSSREPKLRLWTLNEMQASMRNPYISWPNDGHWNFRSKEVKMGEWIYRHSGVQNAYRETNTNQKIGNRIGGTGDTYHKIECR